MLFPFLVLVHNLSKSKPKTCIFSSRISFADVGGDGWDGRDGWKWGQGVVSVTVISTKSIHSTFDDRQLIREYADYLVARRDCLSRGTGH